MQKSKKIFIIILSVILILLVLLNLAWSALITWTLNDMSANPYAYYPFLQPSDNYLDINDVGFISYDVVRPNEEKIENGEQIKIYTGSEVAEILRQALENNESQ